MNPTASAGADDGRGDRWTAAAALRGVVPAIVTPFDREARVDVGVLEHLTEHLVSSGVHAIMATGGTGEFPNLRPEERRVVLEAVTRATGGRVPVIAGTAACSLDQTFELASDAAEAGCDAIITVPPFYFPLPEAALEEFFLGLADTTPLPLFVYNNPLYTGNPLSPDLIARLLRHPRVAGLKQSASDLGQLVDVLYRVRVVERTTKAILTGIDSQIAAACAVGADGVFSTAAGIVPRQVVELWESIDSGKVEDARARQLELQPLNRFLEYDPGYVAPAKEALQMMGFEVGEGRAPLPGLADEERVSLRRALEELGALATA